MKESIAKEKLRVIDIIRENGATILTIGGFVWILYSSIIMPIKQLEFSVGDIIGNHLKTIEDEIIVATEERKEQSLILNSNSERLVRIETSLEQLLKK